MKSLFTLWPAEMNELPKEKKREAIQTIVNKSKKLKTTVLLSVIFDMIAVCVLIYFAIFVYGINIERGSLESIYLIIGCLAACSLWMIPVKIVARSEYYRLKPEMY